MTLDEKLNEIVVICENASPVSKTEAIAMRMRLGDDTAELLLTGEELLHRIVLALQKCREQRNKSIQAMDVTTDASNRLEKGDDAELLKLLTKE